MEIVRRFNTQKSIRLFMADIYKEIDSKKKLTENEINYYKLKLQVLKEIAYIIRNEHEKRLDEIEFHHKELEIEKEVS